MSIPIKQLNRLSQIHALIQKGRTGPASEMARKLRICRSAFENYLSMLRLQGLPISWNPVQQTYYYEEDVVLHFEIKVGEKRLVQINYDRIK